MPACQHHQAGQGTLAYPSFVKSWRVFWQTSRRSRRACATWCQCGWRSPPPNVPHLNRPPVAGTAAGGLLRWQASRGQARPIPHRIPTKKAPSDRNHWRLFYLPLPRDVPPRRRESLLDTRGALRVQRYRANSRGTNRQCHPPPACNTGIRCRRANRVM